MFLGFDLTILINLNGSNYQEYTEKFVSYYRLLKNVLFKLEDESAMDIMNVYNVRIIIIIKITNKV